MLQVEDASFANPVVPGKITATDASQSSERCSAMHDSPVVHK